MITKNKVIVGIGIFLSIIIVVSIAVLMTHSIFGGISDLVRILLVILTFSSLFVTMWYWIVMLGKMWK
jgi:hypothetical protein